MKSLADFIIAFFDLLEAEADGMRANVWRMAIGIAFLAVMAILMAVAVGLFLLGFFLAMQAAAGAAAAAALTGVIALIFAGGCLWIAGKIAHGP